MSNLDFELYPESGHSCPIEIKQAGTQSRGLGGKTRKEKEAKNWSKTLY